jgi:hypothetical protein
MNGLVTPIFRPSVLRASSLRIMKEMDVELLA